MAIITRATKKSFTYDINALDNLEPEKKHKKIG